jgi:hypothetical protein
MENMPGVLEVLKKPFGESRRSTTVSHFCRGAFSVEEVLGGMSMIF